MPARQQGHSETPSRSHSGPQGATPGADPDAATSVASAGRLSARDLALIAAFGAFIVVLGLPGALFTGSAVPITLQTLGVMLAGALLGRRRGLLAVLVVLALCAVGLPVIAGGRGGIAVFAGPTVGYLLGWLPGVWLIGLLVERARRLSTWGLFGAILLGGVVVIHVCGIAGMMARAGLGLQAAVLADTVFLPGDLLKVLLATFAAATVHRALPDLPARRAARPAAGHDLEDAHEAAKGPGRADGSDAR